MTAGASDRYLSTAETVAALGVTARALRIYEQRGLVKPLRTAAGWRTYGPDALARLHQIVTLKRLGLSLAAIGDLLKGRLDALDTVLALQEDVLRRQRSEADQALVLLAAARAKLAGGRPLSLDDLTTLTRETAMSKRIAAEEWREIFEPLGRKHFTPEELERLDQDRREDTAAGGRDWEALIAEAKAVMSKGDPTSPEAADIVRRWKALQDRSTGGDPEVTAKFAAMWRDALTDPDNAGKLPIDLQLWNFFSSVSAALKAAGG